MKIEKPLKVSRSYVQQLNAPPKVVFPLLCPVREADWVEGWDPEVVFTHSGVAESGCVFITKDTGPGGGAKAVWVVTHHDPSAYQLEMLKVTFGKTVARLEISLEPDGSEATRAEVVYAHTALSEAGRDVVARFTEEHYQGFMHQWEDALNRHLLKLKAGI